MMTTEFDTIKTSDSHPLEIAEVRAAPEYGCIGITFCPGKVQNSPYSGKWERDLDLDLDAIRDWGAAAVITLIEGDEFSMLQVERLGEAVAERHMDWFHLPITDVSVPDNRFEVLWEQIGPQIRFRLRNGFNVLVHCKGGLGRAGTIAAKLLVELGLEAEQAIQMVRDARSSHAIETREQEGYVRRQAAIDAPAPLSTQDAIRNRAVGALLGLAVGDAVGTTLEFQSRDSYAPLTDMIGGGPFRLEAGQWTDDTALALALADSLIEVGQLDEADLMRRFVAWRDEGRYSCTGSCFDIGITTSDALSRWKRTGNPVAGSINPSTAGNGSLMRLSPVALRYWDNRPALKDAAARQSRVTHGAEAAVDACVAYAGMIADAIAGKPLQEVLKGDGNVFVDGVADILSGSWRKKARQQVPSSGYVLHSLEAAIWSIARSGDFSGAVLTAANLGDDADTTAAIAGQLAGAAYGVNGMPAAWRNRVAWSDKIVAMAERLLER